MSQHNGKPAFVILSNGAAEQRFIARVAEENLWSVLEDELTVNSASIASRRPSRVVIKAIWACSNLDRFSPFLSSPEAEAFKSSMRERYSSLVEDTV